jgi:DNA-binding transcriptional LysR family regulator
MSSFHKAHPHIKINLSIGSSLEMIRSLLDCKIELALVAKLKEDPTIRFIPYSELELVPVASSDHRLAQKQAVSFEELSAEPIIKREIGSGSRKLVDELYAQNECVPNILMETENIELIKQLVQRGEGIAFLINASVSSEINEKKLARINLRGHKILLRTYIAFLKKQQLSPAAQAFLKYAQDNPPTLD